MGVPEHAGGRRAVADDPESEFQIIVSHDRQSR